MLGKSPHEYFQARMELANYHNKVQAQAQDKKLQKPIPAVEKKSIEFWFICYSCNQLNIAKRYLSVD